MKFNQILTLIGAVVALQGCLYTNVAMPSAFPRPDTRIDVKDMTVVGPAHGEACGTEIIGLIYTGDFGYEDAYKDALAKSGGTVLYDVKVDAKLTQILGYPSGAIGLAAGGAVPAAPSGLYGTLCTEVSGIAVK